MEEDYAQLYKVLGCELDPAHLRQALTHRSYSYENNMVPDNERLEHLGDAVLQLVVSERLYETFSDSPESTLTKMRANIVNTYALAKAARSLELGKYVYLGNGEENQGGRDKDSILADTIEAVFGVIFQKYGYDKTREILSELFRDAIINADARTYRTDWKTPLQELLAERKLPTAKYEVERFGPEHKSTFIAKIFINQIFFGKGEGSNRRSAEQQAARLAWTNLSEDPGFTG